MLCFIVIFHITSLATIWFSGQVQNSAYDLYFQTRDPILSVDRLGLLTTMRLDVQRSLSDWSPAHTPPVLTVFDQESLPEKTSAPETFKDHTEPVESDERELSKKEEREDHTLDIDFDELISAEADGTIQHMHAYFKSVEPTAKNDHTGKYEGYNLIVITAESFSSYAVHEEVTPTLYKMVHEGYNFSNFYVPLWDVSSSDGEYSTLTSLVPKSGIWSFSASATIDLPFVLGNQLKALNYKTVAYHNHTYTYYNRDASHPNMGYDYTGVGNGLEISGGWPGSDLEMMQETVPDYIGDSPFHAYYITVSGHMQYSFSGNNMAHKNRYYVDHLAYSDQAKAYLSTQIELDRALDHLLTQLEEASIADQTLIVLVTDHYPYGLDYSTINELAGHEVDRSFELYKSPLIIYSKDMDPVTIDKPSSNLDIVPTLYNLLGVEFDSRLFMGKDIFSDASPLVMFRDKSFITDKGQYNSATSEFIATEDPLMEDVEEYIEAVSLSIDNKFYYSSRILETNYYNRLGVVSD
ncbi:MAG: LTA synthase family protein [Alkalibacterium sp.]|nr:LTA synthase family protein [Alkalibacterium sp.]